ncbi:MAG: ABC transporter [Arcobacter sp.]|nr:MAG: ABC transporter [Arcobacter sp.]
MDMEENADVEEDEFLDEFEEEMKIETKSDPLSGYNRVMTSFNDGLYEYVLSPIANGYRYVVHKEIRSSVGNFFHNILYPMRFINNLLQGKLKNSAEETGRFLINSTIGILGLFDPAKSWFDLEPHNEDFGQTLGFYGVGAGPHIVLPFFGPSNLRDALSLYPDGLLNPAVYNDDRGYNITNSYGESLVLKAYQSVNDISLRHGEYEKLKKDAIDLYPYLRDIYEQYREKEIKE